MSERSADGPAASKRPNATELTEPVMVTRLEVAVACPVTIADARNTATGAAADRSASSGSVGRAQTSRRVHWPSSADRRTGIVSVAVPSSPVRVVAGPGATDVSMPSIGAATSRSTPATGVL